MEIFYFSQIQIYSQFLYFRYFHISLFLSNLKKINFKTLCYLIIRFKKNCTSINCTFLFFFLNSKTDLVLREHCRHIRIVYHFVFLILLDFSFYHSSFTALRLYVTFYKSIDLFIQVCFLVNHCCIHCMVYIYNAYPIQILSKFFIYFIFFFNM